MSDEELPPLTDDVPEEEQGDVGPVHFVLAGEDGSIEAEEEPDVDV